MNSTRLAGIGAFVVGGFLLFAIGLFMIGDRQMAFADTFSIYTEFAKITGLQAGSVIRVSGAPAGSVRQILPPADPGGRFRVRLEIIEDLHQLVRTDSVASIESEGLVGGSYLAVSTGSASAPPVPAGGTIPSREPFEIADLMAQMSSTITNVNKSLELVTGQIETALTSVDTTVQSANALIDEVTDDVKTMASAGSRISADVAEITEGIRRGEGTIGRFVRDDSFYERAEQIADRATRIAEGAEAMTGDLRKVIEQARQALENLQGEGGAVTGLTTELTETLRHTRDAMRGFSENMEALSQNFLFRGFFNRRGYFNLADIAPADYRRGILEVGNRRAVRVWLRDDRLFANGPDGREQLTDAGRARLDSALAPFLDQLGTSVLVAEGYAQEGSRDERFLRSRARAAAAREYLVEKFALDPQAVGAMPMGADAEDSPAGDEWSGVALAMFLERR